MNDSLPKRTAIYDQDSEEIHFVEYETDVFAAVVSLFFFFFWQQPEKRPCSQARRL